MSVPLLQWRQGRSVAEQTALMAEHTDCTHCFDNREIVLWWEHGNAVWGPCPCCNPAGRPAPSWAEWHAAHEPHV
jgi:hypothetical protein